MFVIQHIASCTCTKASNNCLLLVRYLFVLLKVWSIALERSTLREYGTLASQKRNARRRLFHRKGESFHSKLLNRSVHWLHPRCKRPLLDSREHCLASLPRFCLCYFTRSISATARTIRCPVAAEGSREVEKNHWSAVPFHRTWQTKERENACFVFTKVARTEDFANERRKGRNGGTQRGDLRSVSSRCGRCGRSSG